MRWDGGAWSGGWGVGASIWAIQRLQSDPSGTMGWEGRYTLVLSGTANRHRWPRPRPGWLVGLGKCAEYFLKCDLVAGCGQRFLPAPSPPASTGAPSQAGMQGVQASARQLPNRVFEASIVVRPAATQRILFSAFRVFVVHRSRPPPEMKRGTPALV